MKAFILAAGFGTRLKPWTDRHPKALVPVGGIPMLRRVIERLEKEGFDDITVNVHHFSDQIIDYINASKWESNISISDESSKILDTGGGVMKFADSISDRIEPFLVHNVDILSDAPLSDLMSIHKKSGRNVSLVTSERDSSRKLLFDGDGNLKGWHNLKTDEYRPAGLILPQSRHRSAFSGIYIMDKVAVKALKKYSESINSDVFPIMDFFLADMHNINIGEIKLDKLNLTDIGKPETLRLADEHFRPECI